MPLIDHQRIVIPTMWEGLFRLFGHIKWGERLLMSLADGLDSIWHLHALLGHTSSQWQTPCLLWTVFINGLYNYSVLIGFCAVLFWVLLFCRGVVYWPCSVQPAIIFNVIWVVACAEYIYFFAIWPIISFYSYAPVSAYFLLYYHWSLFYACFVLYGVLIYFVHIYTPFHCFNYFILFVFFAFAGTYCMYHFCTAIFYFEFLFPINSDWT